MYVYILLAKKNSTILRSLLDPDTIFVCDNVELFHPLQQLNNSSKIK